MPHGTPREQGTPPPNTHTITHDGTSAGQSAAQGPLVALQLFSSMRDARRALRRIPAGCSAPLLCHHDANRVLRRTPANCSASPPHDPDARRVLRRTPAGCSARGKQRGTRQGWAASPSPAQKGPAKQGRGVNAISAISIGLSLSLYIYIYQSIDLSWSIHVSTYLCPSLYLSVYLYL